MRLSTAIAWPNNKAYFFNGTQYYRIDMTAKKADPGYPRAVKSAWPGLWGNGGSASVLWNNGKAYFFKGSQYIRYAVSADKTDPGYPKSIANHWPGLWTEKIDAAVLWNNGKAYFFKGGEYIRYDIAGDRSDAGYPRPIEGNWPGLWESGIDAAVMWNNGKAYFFKGDQYIRVDAANKKADAGFPRSIAGNWPGVVPGMLAQSGNLQVLAAGGGGGGVPASRIIAVQGMIQIQDYEVFGSNEHSTTPVNDSAAISKDLPVPARLVEMEAVCGGEIRVELDLKVSIAEANHVIVSGTGKFFEGTDISTGDLEQTKNISILLPPGVPTEYKLHLYNEDEEEHEDNADIWITLTNEAA